MRSNSNRYCISRFELIVSAVRGDSNPVGRPIGLAIHAMASYVIAASIRPTLLFEIKQTVNKIQLKKSWNSSSIAGLFAARFATTRFMRFLFKISGSPMKLIIIVSSITMPAIWKFSIPM